MPPMLDKLQQYLPFTVLKQELVCLKCPSSWQLQQYLPFTVLKLMLYYIALSSNLFMLQQYLPFTVLKLIKYPKMGNHEFMGCNSTYRLRY